MQRRRSTPECDIVDENELSQKFPSSATEPAPPDSLINALSAMNCAFNLSPHKNRLDCSSDSQYLYLTGRDSGSPAQASNNSSFRTGSQPSYGQHDRPVTPIPKHSPMPVLPPEARDFWPRSLSPRAPGAERRKRNRKFEGRYIFRIIY